ncbi:helix-turn-helix transcriptional regulator [Allofournierella sp.]|uniref:helix-turn-helix transcriptional regulator n=1 Tax=Allofournierella sp. TaxID=1940256 RepID=UPI003AB5BE9A
MWIKHIHYQTRNTAEEYYYCRPHGLNEYVLILAHTPAYFCADGTQYLLRKHQLFIYAKKQPQLFFSAGEDFVHDWFHFDMTQQEDSRLRSLGITFGKPLSPSNPFILSDLIRLLAFEYSDPAEHSTEVIAKLMVCFFLKLSDMLCEASQLCLQEHIYYQPFAQLRSRMRSFPYQNWSLDEAARSVNMSKTWFQHNYREIFGVTFQEDFVNSRIDYAKKILLQSDSSIAYIAELCGYNSDTHFMRQFKQRTGFTPTAYRQHMAVLEENGVHDSV